MSSTEQTAPPAPHEAAPPFNIGVSLARSLIAVLVGSLVLRLAAQAMNLMLGYYFVTINRDHYPVSYTTFGLIAASFFITELVGAPLLGAMSDRYGRRIFILLGPLFGVLAMQITSLTVAIWLLVVTRLLEGLSTASAVPATLGYISEATAHSPKLRARVIGLFEITLVGGLALGSVAGAYLWEYFSQPVTLGGIEVISPAFGLNSLIYLASFAVFAWGLKDLRRVPSSKPGNNHLGLSHFGRILKSRHVWKFVPAWLALNSIIGIWVNHSARLMTGEHHSGQLLSGLGHKAFGFGYAGLAVVFALGVLTWSFVMGKRRRTNIMLIATGGLGVTLLTVYAINELGSFSHPAYLPLLVLFLIGLFVLSGFTPAALTYLADVTEAHSEERGSIMGLYSFFFGVGQVVGSSLGGRFADWGGINGLLLLSGLFGAITAFTLLALRRDEIAAPLRIPEPAAGD